MMRYFFHRPVALFLASQDQLTMTHYKDENHSLRLVNRPVDEQNINNILKMHILPDFIL